MELPESAALGVAAVIALVISTFLSRKAESSLRSEPRPWQAPPPFGPRFSAALPATHSLFVALVTTSDEGDVVVYLVNNTPHPYSAVTTRTGMHESFDDAFVQSTIGVRHRGPLPEFSAVLIEESPGWERDFTIWYEARLQRVGASGSEEIGFGIPKNVWDLQLETLPIVDRPGIRLYDTRQTPPTLATGEATGHWSALPEPALGRVAETASASADENRRQAARSAEQAAAKLPKWQRRLTNWGLGLLVSTLACLGLYGFGVGPLMDLSGALESRIWFGSLAWLSFGGMVIGALASAIWEGIQDRVSPTDPRVLARRHEHETRSRSDDRRAAIRAVAEHLSITTAQASQLMAAIEADPTAVARQWERAVTIAEVERFLRGAPAESPKLAKLAAADGNLLGLDDVVVSYPLAVTSQTPGAREAVRENPLVARALALAAAAHRDQKDKVGWPYIGHALRVMHDTSRELGARPSAREGKEFYDSAVAAALLHDVVEDCGVTLANLSSAFGERVASAVDGLTHRDGETYYDYIARCARDPIANLVKRMDIKDNSDPARQFRGHESALTDRYPKALAILAAAQAQFAESE